ncbi:hypothetical protein C8J55DRAFT_488087 [Lentinula edodes]|uniref:Uncharacterized protein n=1 Tax=Lentinula lateritia TaxID=40482 RepID=A0A9W9AJD5_9AGAR|nr:hypothetical protein C8J55DRAFT_488087 [Lentinula edodes]
MYRQIRNEHSIVTHLPGTITLSTQFIAVQEGRVYSDSQLIRKRFMQGATKKITQSASRRLSLQELYVKGTHGGVSKKKVGQSHPDLATVESDEEATKAHAPEVIYIQSSSDAIAANSHLKTSKMEMALRLIQSLTYLHLDSARYLTGTQGTDTTRVQVQLIKGAWDMLKLSSLVTNVVAHDKRKYTYFHLRNKLKEKKAA